jgi:hypothetical protein
LILPLLLTCAGYFWTFNFSEAPFANPAVVAAGCGQEILDIRLHYDAPAAYQALECYGPAGRAAYAKFLWVDVTFALVYGMAFSLLLSWLIQSIKAEKSFLRWTALLPFGIALADMLENTLLSRLIATYPEKHMLLANLAGYTTSVKWALSALTIPILFAIAATLCWQRALRH